MLQKVKFAPGFNKQVTSTGGESQWINGDNKGYCFGFEGPPGIGKTSLAKNGLSKCLIDEDGSTRPFSLIAMGGSSNGTILEGHSYTYVGSNWGKIVDILMDKKIMNPIIFIDELDKVSRTEQGKEIIDLSLGQSDFKSPKHAVDAAIKALKDGHHGYTLPNGMIESRQAVSRKIKSLYNAEINPKRIVIMPGGKPTMHYAISFFGEPGAEIIYPDPGFPIYESMIKYTGAKNTNPEIITTSSKAN